MRIFTSAEVCEWLAGVGHLAGAVAAAVPLPELLDQISSTACELTGYEACAVLLADDDRQCLIISGSAGLSVEYVAAVNKRNTITLTSGPLSGGPSSRAFAAAEPVVIDDIGADESFAPWAGAADYYGYRSMAAVPLVLGGEAVGTLNCYRTCVHDFTAEEIALLQALANQASTALQSSRLINSLTVERRLAQQSEAIHRELTKVALRAGGVQGVAEALARLQNQPVLVTDVDQAPIANAPRRGVQLAPEDVSEDSLPRHGVAEVPSIGRVSAPVLLGRELVARIWLPGALDEFADLDVRAMEHAAVVCALELLRQRTAADVEWRMRSDLLADLLADGVSGPLRARAVGLGHDLSRAHTVVVAAPDAGSEPGVSRALLAAVRDIAAQCAPKPLVTTIDDDVVSLWPDHVDSRPPEAIAEQIRGAVARQPSDGTVSVVVGHRFDDVDAACAAVGTARGALAVARLHQPDRVVTLPDLGVYGLLVQLNDPRELVRFASRTLSRLRDYDAQRDVELLDTVRAYLGNEMNVARTAKALYVHQNTVGLRLKKVEELTGLSIREPEAMLRLKLALMIDEVFGRGADPL